jgi:ClpX C4-type zinc finger
MSIAIMASGECSFCGKDSQAVSGLAGTKSQTESICNECVEICLRILLDDMQMETKQSKSYSSHRIPSSPVGQDFEITEMVRHHKGPATRRELARLLSQTQGLLGRRDVQRSWSGDEMSNFACTFCGRKASKIRKIIAGPKHYVCVMCVREAASLFLQNGV